MAAENTAAASALADAFAALSVEGRPVTVRALREPGPGQHRRSQRMAQDEPAGPRRVASAGRRPGAGSQPAVVGGGGRCP